MRDKCIFQGVIINQKIMKLACFLSVLIQGQDVEDRLAALEQQVDYNSRELTKLRSRIGDVEYRLEEVVNHLNDTVEPRVANNTGSIDWLRHRVESIEDSLQCSGDASLDVCGCPNGYTYYQEECVSSDEKAARSWIDDFNVGYQVHVHDYTVAAFAYETNITDHNLAQVRLQ